MRCTLPSLFALTLLSAAGAAVASDYIGVRQCKSCHEQAYKQWKQTPHARAAERLGPAERRDPRCTACHSTAVDDGLEGVQCEACHGPGRYYWPDAVMRDGHLARAVGLRRGDDPLICNSCHTADPPKLVPFDAAAAMAKVRHRAPETP